MTKELLGGLELNRIYQRDCIEGMKLLPDGTSEVGIDLTVTSPPYDNLRNYKGYSFDFENTAKELYRITKDGGIVVWIVGDATVKGSETGTSFNQALYFKEIGFNLHDTMIFAKNNPVPQFKSKRYTNSFEYMFIFSKGAPLTCNYLTEPSKKAAAGAYGKYRRRSSESLKDSSDRNNGDFTEYKKDKIRSNIWFYSVGNSGQDKLAHKHPAIFPEKLAEEHILSWSNDGDIVLDPFMGSGTTAKMALRNNRNFIGFEISAEYVELANKRLNNEEESE